ncbi:uncharacterized protein TNCV_810941 [Trichonephila clavipes]|uniref:Uncharacterized protein n=1 Tax=Trichonephila clavipes TaxID=2585209 RepID=A0A8X6SHR8_TRICX|nr:uncharacterized protein TNCV_810941 [Trichonephila clavipes]
MNLIPGFKKSCGKTSKTSPTKIYELRTVTSGTASAPYLATKVWKQLALDEEKNFPLASKVLLQNFYMDDCLSGSELMEFKTLQLELKQLFQRGGMTLRKWCTNLSPTTAQEEFPLDRNSEEIQVKPLGMIWNSVSIPLLTKPTSVLITAIPNETSCSRSHAFGLLCPVISKAKIFVQQLWLLKLD